MPSWSVVTTTNAALPLIKAFIAYHLSIGAQSVHIFLDSDHDRTASTALSGIQGVHVTLCDASYWMAHGSGHRPKDHRRRQVLNANIAKTICTADWIAHIDIDEYIFAPDGIDETLKNSHSSSILLSTAEVFFLKNPETFGDVFNSPFHKPIPKSDPELNEHKFFSFNTIYLGGVQGHSIGKVICRTNSDETLGIHRASGESPERCNVYVLHYHAMGYADWCGKYLRRLQPDRFHSLSPKLKQRYLLFLSRANQGEKQIRNLFNKACIYTPAFVELLRNRNLVVEPNLRLEQRIRELFGPGDHLFSEQLPDFPHHELLKSLPAPETLASSTSPVTSKGKLPAGNIGPTDLTPVTEIRPIEVRVAAHTVKSDQLFDGHDRMFKSVLSNTTTYGEYGCGASTIWVSRNTRCKILSVDSSTEWIARVRDEVRGRDQIELEYADVGRIGKWGRPVGYEKAAHFPHYTNWMWLTDDKPDTVLVDGRFRVCCFLTSLRRSDEGTTIIFDDYTNRSHYHFVEKFIRPVEYCGRQARFVVPKRARLDLRKLDESIVHFRYVLD